MEAAATTRGERGAFLATFDQIIADIESVARAYTPLKIDGAIVARSSESGDRPASSDSCRAEGATA